MIRTFSDAELGRLNSGLKAIAAKDMPAHVRLAEELACIKRSTDALSYFVMEHPFEDLRQEIDYHKHIYPQFRCLYIYQAEVHRLNAQLPDWDKKTLKKYYRSRKRRIVKEVESENLHYAYFKLKADDLDDLYFRTDPGRHSVLIPVLSEPADCRSTAMGCLFARFRAAELLYRYILIRQEELEPKADVRDKRRRPLKWTGDVIHLIEIAHGLHLSGEINKGKTGIVELFEELGDYFGVNLGVPKKGFDNMKNRKRLGQTYFTDSIREKILRKMRDEDEWKPRN